MSFADTAARAAGAAAALLGWRPGEFWAATPAELATAFGWMIPDVSPALGSRDLDRLKERFPDG